MQFACEKMRLKDSMITDLMTCLKTNGNILCYSAEQAMKEEEEKFNSGQVGYSNAEVETFNKLVARFFLGIKHLGIPSMNQEEVKKDYVYRITEILHCKPGDELFLDSDKVEKMPVNSDTPIFRAAEIFKETMLEVGVPE